MRRQETGWEKKGWNAAKGAGSDQKPGPLGWRCSLMHMVGTLYQLSHRGAPFSKFYQTFCSIRNVAHFRNQSMFSTLIHLILFTANCGKFKTFSGHSKHSKLEVIVTRKYLIQWINIEFVLLRLCFIKRHRFNPFSFYVFRHQATNRCQCWSDKIPLTAPVHFNASK